MFWLLSSLGCSRRVAEGQRARDHDLFSALLGKVAPEACGLTVKMTALHEGVFDGTEGGESYYQRGRRGGMMNGEMG